jgi:putative aldouronate transport system substrate-binding protein
MKNMFRVLSLVLVMVFTVALLLSGCGETVANLSEDTDKTVSTAASESTATEKAKLEYVKLKMYFLGDEPQDVGIVFKELNKKMKEKINAEIEPAFLSWGDWDKKYPLLFSSGEDFDMIYTANWAFYAETASKGGFYELTMDMLNKYCPETMKVLPKAAWQNSTVNGKNFMIPNNNTFAQHYGVIVRGDLREKYGHPELKTIQDVEKFMDVILDNEKGMVPLDVSRDNAEMLVRAFVLYPAERYYLGAGALTFDFTDPKKFDLKPYYEVDGYLDHVKRMVDWNKKGYISKSDLTTANSLRFEAGKSAVVINNLGGADGYYQKTKSEHLDWKIEFVNLLEGKKLSSQGYSGNGMGINAKTKNLERALMAMDLLGYDPDINFLVCNGIPDVHNRIAGKVKMDGREFKQIESVDPSKYYGFSTWCFINDVSFPVETFSTFNELTVNYLFKQKVNHPLDGFTFVTDAVNTEVANTTSITQEYGPILHLGFNNDAEKTLNEFIAKLKNAGIDKIHEEGKVQAKKLFDSAQ